MRVYLFVDGSQLSSSISFGLELGCWQSPEYIVVVPRRFANHYWTNICEACDVAILCCS